jgi:hypothetical protein
MSLTSNFDFAVELEIDIVKQIFHLAFKSEDLFPHNVGPFILNLSGQQVSVKVRVLDDDDRPADLSFKDDKHILFSFPFEMTVETPGAPDPSLTRITMEARVNIPGKLDNWNDGTSDLLGINFADVTDADVEIVSLEGLPTIDITNIAASIHSKYDVVPHTYSDGANVLIVYDDTRDGSLMPPNLATPFDITPTLETVSGTNYVKVIMPIHVHVPQAFYDSYGKITFHRTITTTDTTITLDMTTEPLDASLKTTIDLDTFSPVKSTIIGLLQPRAVAAIAGFGVITEPAFSDAAARTLLKQQIAAYIKQRKYPVYTPQSGDPTQPLTTPVGFLLVAPGVLAILMNRRDSSVADSAPDDFLGTNQLGMAVGRAKVDEIIRGVINAQFPDLAGGGQEIHTSQGSGTLTELNVEPADAGQNGQTAGHLWTTGKVTVHIDCWPDPHVSFEGPIFIDTTLTRTDDACTLTTTGRAGDFDVDQSCCDVFMDLMIPIVGWIVLGITEHLINEVGGELISDIASRQSKIIHPIPPAVNGVAQVSACLTGLTITSGGFIFPGEVSVRRLSTSFEDLADSHHLPGP